MEVQINPEEETVWLTQKQIGELFGVKQATLSEHINNIITSVGYRVNSKRGIAFRKWAKITASMKRKNE